MKRYIFFLLICFCVSCQKQEIATYSLVKNSIHFGLSTSEMTYEFNFAEQTYSAVEIYPWGQWTVECCYGDSLLYDTLSVPVSIMGFSFDKAVNFKLKVVPIEGKDSTQMGEVILNDNYVFKEGQLRDTVQIILVRPKRRGEFFVGVTFDPSSSDNYEVGAKEQAVFQLNIKDQYSRPVSWEYNGLQYYYGDYSEEKWAFMVSVIQRGEYGTYWPNEKDRLVEALNRYNEEHPDEPKNFSFPD